MKKFLVLFLFGFSLMGCRKPDPLPELRDPIYQSIQSKLKEAEINTKSAEKELKEIKEKLKDITPQTREGKNLWSKFFSG